MKQFMYPAISVLCLSTTGLIGLHVGNRAANATSGCTYEAACLSVAGPDVGNLYVLRSDGLLSRYEFASGTFLEFQHHAPQGRYVALVRKGDWSLVAIREDGAMFKTELTGPNEWTSFGSFSSCAPVAASSATVGGVKSKYR